MNTEELISTLNSWGNETHAAQYRDKVKRAAQLEGYDPRCVGEYIRSKFAPVTSLSTNSEVDEINAGEIPNPEVDLQGFLTAIIQSVYQGEGMKEPSSAMRNVRTAKRMGSSWNDLPEPAQGFYKSMHFHFLNWLDQAA